MFLNYDVCFISRSICFRDYVSPEQSRNNSWPEKRAEHHITYSDIFKRLSHLTGKKKLRKRQEQLMNIFFLQFEGRILKHRWGKIFVVIEDNLWIVFSFSKPKWTLSFSSPFLSLYTPISAFTIYEQWNLTVNSVMWCTSRSYVHQIISTVFLPPWVLWNSNCIFFNLVLLALKAIIILNTEKILNIKITK